jgi:transposase
MYKEIQKFKKKGYLKSEISRKMRIDPATAAKYYNMNEIEYREYVNSLMYRDKSFDRYKGDILEVYENNDYRRIPMASVYDYLEERHDELPGTEKSLRNYIGYLRETNQLELNEKKRSYCKVAQLPMGKQMQVDFGEYRTKSGLKLYIFASVLSASRYKYVAIQHKPFTTMDLIQHLLDCFDYVGGTPEELVIDQDRVMVVSENHGDIIFTEDFLYFIEEMGLKLYVCRKADPETKGKVENLVKYVKYNFFSIRDFESIEEARESLKRWLVRRANGKISQATKRIPLEMKEEEREHLRAVRNSIYRKGSLVGREERSADDNGRISVNASQYSLPEGYEKKVVEIYTTQTMLFVFDRFSGEQIAEHTLSVTPGRVINKREHNRQKNKSIKTLKEEVLKKYTLDKWQEFVEENFKRFPRYVRDQCIEALRRFGDDVDQESLEQALCFCLDHKTLSMRNLYDTYKYYEGLKETDEKDILMKIAPQLKAVSRYKSDIRVAKRDLSVYKSLVGIIMGVLR